MLFARRAGRKKRVGSRLRKVGIESDVACGAHAIGLSYSGGERVDAGGLCAECRTLRTRQ